jgi:hypothetical protein
MLCATREDIHQYGSQAMIRNIGCFTPTWSKKEPAHEDSDGRRFAGTVRADEAHDAALLKFQVDVFEGEVGILLTHTLKMHC